VIFVYRIQIDVKQHASSCWLQIQHSPSVQKICVFADGQRDRVLYRVQRFVVVLRRRTAHEQNLACRQILRFASLFHLHAMTIQDGCPRQLRKAGAKRKICMRQICNGELAALKAGAGHSANPSAIDKNLALASYWCESSCAVSQPRTLPPSPPDKELLAGFASST
jgi:hypothetical protein